MKGLAPSFVMAELSSLGYLAIVSIVVELFFISEFKRLPFLRSSFISLRFSDPNVLNLEEFSKLGDAASVSVPLRIIILF